MRMQSIKYIRYKVNEKGAELRTRLAMKQKKIIQWVASFSSNNHPRTSLNHPSFPINITSNNEGIQWLYFYHYPFPSVITSTSWSLFLMSIKKDTATWWSLNENPPNPRPLVGSPFLPRQAWNEWPTVRWVLIINFVHCPSMGWLALFCAQSTQSEYRMHEINANKTSSLIVHSMVGCWLLLVRGVIVGILPYLPTYLP